MCGVYNNLFAMDIYVCYHWLLRVFKLADSNWVWAQIELVSHIPVIQLCSHRTHLALTFWQKCNVGSSIFDKKCGEHKGVL